MNLKEFKTWFEGFCSAFEDNEYPVKAQWETLKKKISEIQEDKVTINTTMTGGEKETVKPITYPPLIDPDFWRFPQRIGTPLPSDQIYPKYPEIWCGPAPIGDTRITN